MSKSQESDRLIEREEDCRGRNVYWDGRREIPNAKGGKVKTSPAVRRGIIESGPFDGIITVVLDRLIDPLCPRDHHGCVLFLADWREII